MPKPVNHSRPARMIMPMRVPVLVDMTSRARLWIAHDAQDARNTGLPHIDNNHPNATAKHPQVPRPALTRGERIRCRRPAPLLGKIIVPLACH